MTFADLELQTSSIAAGLQEMGVQPGQRIVLLVRFGVDFIALVFALLKAGAVVVLIDPGMGRRHLVRPTALSLYLPLMPSGWPCGIAFPKQN